MTRNYHLIVKSGPELVFARSWGVVFEKASIQGANAEALDSLGDQLKAEAKYLRSLKERAA